MTRPKSYKVLLWKTFLYSGVFGIYSIHLILVAWKVITKNPEFMKHEQLPLKLILASLVLYAWQLTFSLYTAIRLFSVDLRNGFNNVMSHESRLEKRLHNPCRETLYFISVGWVMYTVAGFSFCVTVVINVPAVINNLDPLYEIFGSVFSESQPSFYTLITSYIIRLFVFQLQISWVVELFTFCTLYSIVLAILSIYIVSSLQNITIKDRNYNVIFEYIYISTTMKILARGVEAFASAILCLSMSWMLTLVYATFRLTIVLHPFLILFAQVTLFYFITATYVGINTVAKVHLSSGKLLSEWKWRYQRNRILRKRLNACKPVTVTVAVFLGYSYRNMDMEFLVVYFTAFVDYSINILIATR